MQSATAGYDDPMFARVAAQGTRISNSNATAISVAEMVLASVLDCYQGGNKRRDARANKCWKPLPFKEIFKTRWLIVGFGSIGQEIGKRAKAFSAHVTGIRATGERHDNADTIMQPEAIPSLLPDADVTVLSLPLTTETEKMVNEKFLARMKPGSILVNIARGRLIDEVALVDALDRGRPAHAIMDVFSTEPLPENSVFWDCPRVTMTPHIAGMGSGIIPRSDELFLENLARFCGEKPLINEISPHKIMATAGENNG